MQAAYSIKFGELVPATDADYTDCAKFQLTCPNCREAVFKSFRSTPKPLHYFSHYNRKDDSDCELRVANFARAAGIFNGAINHEQTLQKFLGKFRDSLLDNYNRLTNTQGKLSITDLYNRSYIVEFAQVFQEFYNTVWQVDDPRTNIANSLAQWSIFADKSPFWLRRNSSYILDVLRHLKNDQAISNQKYLIATAIKAWPKLAAKDSPEHVIELIQALADCNSVGTVNHFYKLVKENRNKNYINSTVESKVDVDFLKEKLTAMSKAEQADWLNVEKIRLDNENNAIKSKLHTMKQQLDIYQKQIVNLSVAIELYYPIIYLLAMEFV